MTDPAPPEANAPGDDGEALVFRPDGSIHCRIAGTDYRLRRPNEPEMFDLWHAIDETTAQQSARIEEAEDYADALILYRHAIEDYRRKLEAREDAGKRPVRPTPPSTSAATVEALKSNGAWMRKAFEMLATPTLPAEQTSPGWFTSTQLAGKMLEHWRDIPLDLSALPEDR